MRVHSTILSLGLLALSFSVWAQPTVVKLKGCEYTVELPSKPVYRKGRPAEAGSVAAGSSHVAEIRQSVPAFRVECQPLSRQPERKELAMLDDMEIMARSMNLYGLQLSQEKSKRLGHIGVFSGEQIQAQRRLVVTGRMYLGERSILAVLATEFETGYPSEKVLRVFRSVGR